MTAVATVVADTMTAFLVKAVLGVARLTGLLMGHLMGKARRVAEDQAPQDGKTLPGCNKKTSPKNHPKQNTKPANRSNTPPMVAVW